MDLLYYISPREIYTKNIYYPRRLYVNIRKKDCFNKNYTFNDRIKYQFITLVNMPNCIKYKYITFL